MPDPDELFREKFYELQRRIRAANCIESDETERAIYSMLRSDPAEDIDILAMRVKARLGLRGSA
jgi:hypothetical protein